jgi:CTP synthase
LKYIFVTGGVLSGLGKGITAASIGAILKARGLRVYMQKFDQYLNVDAGTLNPGEHGEVFVTDDGAETDLDLGHYERFIDTDLSAVSSVMTGHIYDAIIRQERHGDYLGKTVQVIPHVTDEVKKHIKEAVKHSRCDVLIAEIGGTVGDYEGMHFLEAIRQMSYEVGSQNIVYVHLGYLPYLGTTEELKTKPVQNSIRTLQSLGIKPNIVFCRSDYPIDRKLLAKVALYGGLAKREVIGLETVSCVYEVPLLLEKYGVGDLIVDKLNLKTKKVNIANWQKVVDAVKKSNKPKIKIGLIGKYMSMKDTYLSVTEAIKSACYNNGYEPQIEWLDSEAIEKRKIPLSTLSQIDCMIVPGGFGSRGIEGKIMAIQYARENNIPFLGLCLGLQTAVIEFARHVCDLARANSTEFNPKTPYPVIDMMIGQTKIEDKGGTMRLGAYPCNLRAGTKVYELYGKKKITERHRHRYEVNPKYHRILEKKGLIIAGKSPNGRLVEFIELKNHPYFVATQAHPEFKSRPHRPHPLFDGLIKATIKDKTSTGS